VSSTSLAAHEENPMSRIAAVDPSTATGTVHTLLEGVQRGLGVTPNLFRVAAQSPAALEGLVALFGAVSKGRFGAKQREAIALTVSEADGCNYCLSAHTALGKGAGLSDADMDKARSATADDARLAATLRFARAVVDRRGHVSEAELADVRRAGLSDAEIVDVVANVALTTFTNYLNDVAQTEIDFPLVERRPR
jgi:uncharacterized peroxidase-related enzyme